LCDLPFACPVESPTWILKRALRKPGYIAQVPRTFSFGNSADLAANLRPS
jgi:hypothetical protein